MDDKKSRNKKQLIKGTLIYAIGNLGTKIISFLIVPLYTYFILPADMGDYDIVITTVSLLTPLITMRISDAAYRWMLHKIDKEENCISATYRVILTSTILAALVLLGINAVIPIKYYGFFIALLVCGRWLESLQVLLRGLRRQSLFALTGVLYTAIYVTLNLIFIAWLKKGVTSLFVSTIISQIIVISIILAAEPRLRQRVLRTSENMELTKSMLLYSAPLVPSGLSWWVMGASDRYVIRFLLGSASTGIYSVANKFPTIVSTLFVIFNNSWTDIAIGNLKEGKETEDYTSELFRQLYELSFGFVLFLIPATKLVTNLVLSKSYKGASTYISFLYLGSIFQGFTTFISAGMLQGTKTAKIAQSSIKGAVVNFVIDILFISRIGIYAASISTFAGYFVMWLSRMKDTKEITPVHIEKKRFIPLFLVSIVYAAASIFTGEVLDIGMMLIGLIVFVLLNRSKLTVILKKGVKRRR